MGVFSRSRSGSALVPSASDLEAFGRYSFSPMDAAPQLADSVQLLESTYYQAASADPASFCQALRPIAETYGGWTSLGACRLIVSLLGGDVRNGDFDAIMRTTLNFLRSRGIPRVHITGYENAWWTAHEGATEPQTS